MWYFVVLLLSLQTVVYCGGTVKVELQEYSYTGCSNTCQMEIKNLTLSTDNIVRKNSSEISLPSGNTVTLLGNVDVPFLKDPFELHFLTGPLGIEFYVMNANNGPLIEHVVENIGLLQYTMATVWEQRVRTRGDKVFKFFIQFTSCDTNFEGDGCGSCTTNYYTSTCDVYCKPVTDQYNCDSSGGRECLGNWEGPDCDGCKLGWDGSNCDTCATGWNGTNCDICATNYYPQGNCSVECIKNPPQSDCTADGELYCLPNFAGDNCTTCKVGWNGTGCDTCATNYYPSGSCSVECVAVDGRSSCNSQGELSCLSNFGGVACDSCNVGWTGVGCDACADNYYPTGRCDVQCVEDSDFTCNEQGERLCTEESTASECKSGVPAAAIGGGVGTVLVLIAVVGVIVLVKRCRGKGEKEGNIEMKSYEQRPPQSRPRTFDSMDQERPRLVLRGQSSHVSLQQDSRQQRNDVPAQSTIYENNAVEREAVYATMKPSRPLDEPPVYATMQKQPAEQPVYSSIDRNRKEDMPVYSTMDREEEDIPGEIPIYGTNRPPEEDQYASVEFFGNRTTIERDRVNRERERVPEETHYARFSAGGTI